MSFTVTLSSPSPSHTHHRRDHRIKLQSFPPKPRFTVPFHSLKSTPPRFLHFLQASRRTSSFPPESNDLVDDNPRNWSRSMEFLDGDDEDDDDDDDEEEDRSLDLLVKFVQNVFKKISKRARKAARSVLPASISTKLVGFSVNGVLVLAFLWVLKAFLEVVCTLGSVVFASILLIRGAWAAITFLQESRNLRMNELDDDHRAWSGAQPAS